MRKVTKEKEDESVYYIVSSYRTLSRAEQNSLRRHFRRRGPRVLSLAGAPHGSPLPSPLRLHSRVPTPLAPVKTRSLELANGAVRQQPSEES